MSELLSSIKPIPSDQETFDKIQGININIENNPNMSNVYQNHSGNGDNVAGDKNVTYNNTQNLAQAAQDIKELIEQLQGDYDSTLIGNMQMGTEIVNRIDQNPTLKARVVNAIKESGVEALKQAISHPVAAIIIAGAQGFMEAE